MFGKLRSRLSYANVMVSIAVFLALGGGAFAATSFIGSDGKVRGCVSKKGQLTVLKRGNAKCAKGLTAISWNQTGPAGQTGGQGPQGGQGLKGDKGDPGPATGAAGGDLSGSYPNPLVADGAVTDSKVAAANKDGAATVPSLRTLGTGDLQAMPGNASPGGPPTGPAGGALAGSYPNPTLNVTGGPCARGQFVTDLSALSALNCGPLGSITALGHNALAANTTGADNSALGQGALLSNTTGPHNSAFGSGALAANTTSPDNSAFGKDALNANTTGANNAALGQSALSANTTASGNSAVGSGALFLNTTGQSNSALGNLALRSNTTGGSNSAVGKDALFANTTADNNAAVGQGALLANTTGPDNSAVGRGALDSNTTGSGNIALGKDAGTNLTTGNNNIDIGNPGVAGESGKIRIGTSGTHTAAFLQGVFGSTVGGSGVPVVVDNSGQLGVTVSSRRFKTRIRPLAPLTDNLMRLRPVSFLYKRKYGGNSQRVQYGLIAEEVAKVFPNLVVRGSDGKPLTVAYQQLPALLLAQVQHEHAHGKRQQRQIDRQQRRNNRQQRQIDRLAAQVHALTRRR